MSRALKSYKQHREKEKAETRKGPFKNAYMRRHHLRPKTAPPARFIESIKVNNMTTAQNSDGVYIPQLDAIKAVSRANPAVNEDKERYDAIELHINMARNYQFHIYNYKDIGKLILALFCELARFILGDGSTGV